MRKWRLTNPDYSHHRIFVVGTPLKLSFKDGCDKYLFVIDITKCNCYMDRVKLIWSIVIQTQTHAYKTSTYVIDCISWFYYRRGFACIHLKNPVFSGVRIFDVLGHPTSRLNCLKQLYFEKSSDDFNSKNSCTLVCFLWNITANISPNFLKLYKAISSHCKVYGAKHTPI